MLLISSSESLCDFPSWFHLNWPKLLLQKRKWRGGREKMDWVIQGTQETLVGSSGLWGPDRRCLSLSWSRICHDGNHLPVEFCPKCLSGQRRQWQPTLVLLPGKSLGWRSLVGCSPWGLEESDRMEQLHFSLPCIGEGNGNPLQCSCLENPRDGGAWWAAVCGVTRSQTQLSDFTFTSMPWRRKWQATPVFLPGESQGWGSLVGCCLWGRTE